MQDDEPLDTEDMAGDLNNLEVFECIGGKRGIIGSIPSARAGTMVMRRELRRLCPQGLTRQDLSRVPTRTVRHNTFAMDIMFHVYVSVIV